MLFFLDVINVQSVTILNISGLYRHTHNPQKNDAHAPTSIKKTHCIRVSAADTFNLQEDSGGVQVGATANWT